MKMKFADVEIDVSKVRGLVPKVNEFMAEAVVLDRQIIAAPRGGAHVNALRKERNLKIGAAAALIRGCTMIGGDGIIDIDTAKALVLAAIKTNYGS